MHPVTLGKSLNTVANAGRFLIIPSLIAALAFAQTPTTLVPPTGVGLYRNGTWFIDSNANGVLDPSDRTFANFGVPGDLPVSGDWDGDGKVEIGVFRPANATFYLDYNGNGAWDGLAIDRAYQFGDPASVSYAGDRPVVGDWNGNGRTKIGVAKTCQNTQFGAQCNSLIWNLDTDGNGVFNPAVDSTYLFGLRNDTPVAGDWDGNGRTDIGIFRDGTWRLDLGNGTEDATDRVINGFGTAGDIPVVGDWNSTLTVKIGVFRPSNKSWYLDASGNNTWEPSLDITYTDYGLATDRPVTGRWNAGVVLRLYSGRIGYFSDGRWRFDTNDNGVFDGPPTDRLIEAFGLNVDQPFWGDFNKDGTLEIAVFRGGAWHIDWNSNGQWDPGVDRSFFFGLGNDIPIVGDWNGNGQTDIGVFRPNENTFFLDYNGNGTWDAGDRAYVFGQPSDMPVAGDWTGDGTTKIGVFRGGSWILDTNGNGAIDANDRTIAVFGAPGDLPFAGDWGGTGKSKVGVYRRGEWFLDSNDSGTFDLADRIVQGLGSFTDKPFVWAVPMQP